MTDRSDGQNVFKAEVHLFRERGRDLVLDVRRNRVRGLTPLEARLIGRADGSPPGRWRLANREEALEAVERLLGEGLLRTEPLPPPRPFEPPPFSLAHLFVNVHQACNLRCPYCFAQQGEFGVRPQTMSAETALRTVDFLMERSGGEPWAGLTFIGGEPLLNWPVVEKAVLRAEQEARRRGKRVGLRVITNGTLLTEPVLAFLKAHRIIVQVSLDGPAELQDRQRPDAAGEGSHGAITARLPRLLSELGEDVFARATVTRATASVPEVVRYLESLGFRKVSFGPVRTRHPEYTLDEAARDRFLEGNAELAREFLARVQRGESPHIGEFRRFLLLFSSGRERVFHCSSLDTSLGVSASGGLYPCNALGEVESARLGHVATGLDGEGLERWRGYLDVDRKPDCRECWARYVCGGGCLAMAQALDGDPARGDREGCAIMRRLTELAIWLHVEIRERAPGYFADMLEETNAWLSR